MIYSLKTPFVVASLGVSVWMMASIENGSSQRNSFHGKKPVLNAHQVRSLGFQSNALFSAAGICYNCHGYDANQSSSVDAAGNDINVIDAWAGTMMANSARDPFWRAKVSHEVDVNPAHQSALEGTCTKCHAPLGKFNAMHLGTPYGMTELAADSVGLDGVSCGACHQQKDTLMGKRFSGELYYDTLKNVYGPFTNPMGPMAGNIGYTPVYSPHINHAGLCGGCHTLITQATDLSGNLTGTSFVEQATYHEWLNSNFNNETFPTTGITCQGCHIPRTNDQVRLSTGPPFGLYRSPFGKHELVGANIFMLRLLKNNRTLLNIYSTAVQLDSSILRTQRMLQQQTLDLNLALSNRTADTAFYSLTLHNKAGHKFPSGYPSRRAYVEFVVRDEMGDTLFKSGIRSNNELVGQDPVFEPHYNFIRDENEVQIYEMVMSDINGDPTSILERGYQASKDNRLAPEGFTDAHIAYDTCKIVGNATLDSDFNRNGATQGTGSDILHYNIPLNGYSGLLNVSARVYYESVPGRFVQEMFSHSTPEIDLFETLFNSADRSPILVAEALLQEGFTNVEENNLPDLIIYPNPSADGLFRFSSSTISISTIEVFDLSGRMIASYQPNGPTQQFQISTSPGIYLVRICTPSGNCIRKVEVR
ncbi:MAG: T9SS type A sorting domain-containing protein [Flavobacteriales bacterium]|nr:T9SS type A sorting domain-containing protein [Flavobacteriales bacterium]